MSQPLPEIRRLLQQAAAAPQPDLSAGVAQFRAQCDAGVVAFHPLVRDHGPLHEERALTVAGVPVRLYLPTAQPQPGVHVHLHGGGWWMGSTDTVAPMARELAHRSGLAVVSVDYRLAPEHPYPAGLDDVCAVLRSLLEGGSELGFRPATVSVGGESAGANLTAATCLRLRDEGGPLPVAQWLDCPAVDLTVPEDASVTAFGSGYGLEVAQTALMLDWYGVIGSTTDPYVSPALAPDLSGLPPALVTTAELDPLRDQGERYADALARAGCRVTLRRAEGHVHASSWWTAVTPGTAATYEQVVQDLVALHQTAEAGT